MCQSRVDMDNSCISSENDIMPEALSRMMLEGRAEDEGRGDVPCCGWREEEEEGVTISSKLRRVKESWMRAEPEPGVAEDEARGWLG